MQMEKKSINLVAPVHYTDRGLQKIILLATNTIALVLIIPNQPGIAEVGAGAEVERDTTLGEKEKVQITEDDPITDTIWSIMTGDDSTMDGMIQIIVTISQGTLHIIAVTITTTIATTATTTIIINTMMDGIGAIDIKMWTEKWIISNDAFRS